MLFAKVVKTDVSTVTLLLSLLPFSLDLQFPFSFALMNSNFYYTLKLHEASVKDKNVPLFK